MICVDSNVAVKWILAEELSEQADALYRDAVRQGQPIVAPPLLPIEVTNTLRQRMRGGQPLSLAEATTHLDRFLTLSITIRNPERLQQTALTITATYNLPAVYDAQYVALAQLLECAFWTADQRLINALGGRLAFVHWIGEYREPAGP